MAITAIGQKSSATRFDGSPDTGTISKIFVPRSAAVAISGADTNAGFVGPTVFHSGDVGANAGTAGTDTTPVNTETYICEVRVSVDATITGISILNGSAAAGNVTVALADSQGNILGKSASTAQSGTNAFQQIPLASAVKVNGPGKYFVVAQFDTNTTPRFRSHAVGNFAAGKLTGQTYGTINAFTVPTTFTASQGPIADTY